MKKGLHPENYRLVAFKDMSNNDVFITKSAVDTKDTIKLQGVEYPLVKLEISRTSHPYYTGKTKLVDTAGRIDKFKNRYAGLSLNKNTEQTPAEKTPATEETPAAEEASTEKTPATEEASAEETPAAEEASTEKNPATEETSAEETPAAEEASAKETPSKEENPATEDNSSPDK